MSSSTILLDHFPPSEQLCYVQCTICQTLLAVSVPSTNLYNTVTVRCGHCNYLLPLNMRPFTFPSSSFFSPHNLLDETPNMSSNFLRNEGNVNEYSINESRGMSDEVLRPPVTNRQENLSLTYSAVQFSTPEKRQRVPSAYNRFIKDEIQRIKAGNPDISHREAFSAAAKNWAHFPHIHFGLMPDLTVKRTNLHQQEGDDVLMRDAFYASANVGVSPY